MRVKYARTDILRVQGSKRSNTGMCVCFEVGKYVYSMSKGTPGFGKVSTLVV